jgi:hypothetical protein
MASVLKVDKLDPQSGTALEIGSSGDTITIPSGATFTQSGTMNASAITAGTVATARLGSGTASSSTVLYGDQTYKTEPGGLTTASQWRLTSDASGQQEPLSANLEVVDTGGYASLGDAMTESSGIFTFPSTGYWLIVANVFFARDGTQRKLGVEIHTTTDDSSYGNRCEGFTFVYDSAASSNTLTSVEAKFLFDVTSTSTHKCKFFINVNNDSNITTGGSTSINYTYFTFIKLADT